MGEAFSEASRPGTRRWPGRTDRMAGLTMLQLRGDERSYGLDWDLKAEGDYSPDELFPHEIRVFVRARYILTDGQTVAHATSIDVPRMRSSFFRASPWASSSLLLAPRELFTDVAREEAAKAAG